MEEVGKGSTREVIAVTENTRLVTFHALARWLYRFNLQRESEIAEVLLHSGALLENSNLPKGIETSTKRAARKRAKRCPERSVKSSSPCQMT